MLFLILLAVQPLGSILRLPRPHKSPCAEPFFVEIAGDDIRYPGIYPVCHRSGLQGLLAVAGGRGAPFGLSAELSDRLDLAKDAECAMDFSGFPSMPKTEENVKRLYEELLAPHLE